VSGNYVSGSNWGTGTGGGLSLSGGSWWLHNVIVSNNTATAAGHANDYGGGLYVAGGLHDYWGVLVVTNFARTTSAAGLYFASGTNRLMNCTITRNRGMGLTGSAGTRLVNTFLVGNGYGDYGGITASAFAYSCATGLTDGVNGNITNEPVFLNAVGGDYRLAKGSVGIDCGQNAEWMIGALDLAGEKRVKDGIVDLGAYESPNKLAGILLEVR